MLRWKFIITRLCLLLGIILLAWLAANPALHWLAIRAGQATTGAKVEIARLRTLLSTTELQLSSVALANPQSPMQNLLEAEQVVLDVELGQLLRRRSERTCRGR